MNNDFVSTGVSPLISFVIYVGIVVSILFIVVSQLTPAIANFRDGIALQDAQNRLKSFDKVLEVVSLGPYSSSALDLSFRRGAFYFNSTENSFYFSIDTQKEIFSPNVDTSIGTLKYESQGKTAKVIKQYNISLINLTGPSFSIFPGRNRIVLTNKGLFNDVLVVEVTRK